jgi:hypothetical protein
LTRIELVKDKTAVFIYFSSEKYCL